MSMDKYAVVERKKMQQDAIAGVRDRLKTLRDSHRKTAADGDEISSLERQEAMLAEALASDD